MKIFCGGTLADILWFQPFLHIHLHSYYVVKAMDTLNVLTSVQVPEGNHGLTIKLQSNSYILEQKNVI